MKPPRLVLLAAAGASLLVFTGCAPTGDVAIEVDGLTYSHADVDLLVDFQCASTAQQADPAAGASTVSRAQVRSEMASRLYDAAVYARVAAEAGVQPNLGQIRTDLAALPDAVAQTVPEKDRQRVIELITDTYESASGFEAAFIKQYGETALSQMDQETLIAAAQELKATVTADGDIELDPVYGLNPDNQNPNASTGSLSLPVSSFAKGAAAEESPAEWIAGLPKNQLCG